MATTKTTKTKRPVPAAFAANTARMKAGQPLKKGPARADGRRKG